MKRIVLAVRILLLPFALLFGLISEVRNVLFDYKILPVYKAKIPVISVGNIQVGGTGKTPFTIWLAQTLASHFKRIAVVSRGYGRRSKGLRVVAERGKILCDVQTAGDEPMLIARKVRPALVIVSEKRKDALRHIEHTQDADLIILDDGFQHRWVARDVDIVLSKAGKKFWENFPLPTGNLREFPWRLKRAHFLIFTGKRPGQKTQRRAPVENQFETSFELDGLVNEHFEPMGALDQLKNKKVVAFAGIAHPESFFTMVQNSGAEPVKTIAFKDHYNYREKDLKKLVEICRQQQAEWLLCTEKDLVKMQNLLPVVETEIKMASLRFAAVGLTLRVKNEKEFLSKLLKMLTK